MPTPVFQIVSDRRGKPHSSYPAPSKRASTPNPALELPHLLKILARVSYPPPGGEPRRDPVGRDRTSNLQQQPITTGLSRCHLLPKAPPHLHLPPRADDLSRRSHSVVLPGDGQRPDGGSTVLVRRQEPQQRQGGCSRAGAGHGPRGGGEQQRELALEQPERRVVEISPPSSGIDHTRPPSCPRQTDTAAGERVSPFRLRA